MPKFATANSVQLKKKRNVENDTLVVDLLMRAFNVHRATDTGDFYAGHGRRSF